MPVENFQEYERDMRDEARQGALENSKKPEQTFAVRKVSGGWTTWNNYEGWVFQSDYEPGD